MHAGTDHNPVSNPVYNPDSIQTFTLTAMTSLTFRNPDSNPVSIGLYYSNPDCTNVIRIQIQ
jgi:hypothetical protein